MKKFILYISLLFVLVGCKDEDFNFNLSGTINGLGNDTLYIYQQEGEGHDLDTIILKDGSFEFAMKVDTITPLILLVNNQTFPIYADKNLKVTIKGNVSALNKLQIEGGALNDKLNQFRNSVFGKDLDAKSENYIRKHPNSLTSIYVLDTYLVQKETPDYHKISELIQLLNVDLRDDARIKQLSEWTDLQLSIEVGKTAPFFHNKDKNNKIITSNDFKDKYILMTFWASWWTPYPERQRAVKNIVNKYKKQNIVLLSVSLDLDRKSWLDAMKKDTLGGVQVTDLRGWENSIVKQYGIEILSSNILIGPDKTIIAKNMNEKELADKLKEIFSK